ncbi:MAG: hypothetical protein M1308_23460 [Actinobacteria bacterium]|nr:hypothetical protein [Actinomycetota bacterium]
MVQEINKIIRIYDKEKKSERKSNLQYVFIKEGMLKDNRFSSRFVP